MSVSHHLTGPDDPERQARNARLMEAVQRAAAAYDALAPEQKAEHDRLQRESWVRGMGPCEHGDFDWETCEQCITKLGGEK